MNSKRKFFSELKRRNVYKVAVAYGVAAWLLIQVATQVFPFFEIPDWAVRLVVLLLFLGFPVALILSWAFEITPEGIKRTEAHAAPSPPSRGHAWIYVVLVAAALSLGLFFLGRYTAPGRGNARPDASDKSIAVPSPTQWSFVVYYQQFFFRRDYDKLIAIVDAIDVTKENLPPILNAGLHLLRGNLRLAKGEKEAALQLAPRAEREMKQLRAQHLSLNELSNLYIEFEARLGHRAEVEAEIAALFERTRRDKWYLPLSEGSAAKGYALLGDLERALPLLRDALQQPSQRALTPALLRLDPTYDAVRDDPRFQALTK